ncbi:MAG TPA: phage tail tape measure protein [Acidobacteriaceae bacterium]|nr:phage tail tape measure protein [Acidobacteriaceae bacterium]
MALRIGTISIQLSAETASFQSDLNKASAVALNSSKNIERSFNIMGAAVATATGAAVGALGLLIERTEDTVFQMQKMAQQSGTTLETFSKFAYIAKQSGMPLEQMAVSMTRLGAAAFEAASGVKQPAEAFKAIGVSVKDANGHIKDTSSLLRDVAGALNKFADGPGKEGIEKMIIGRSGPMAAEFLAMVANRYDELTDRAQKLGVVFDQDLASSAQKLHEGFVDIGEAAEGLGVRLLTSVTPELEKLTDPPGT